MYSCKNALKFLVFTFLMFFLCAPKSAAIEAIEDKAPLVTKTSLDEIFKKAKEHSYDLKIADYEAMIAKTGITSARSEYFPKLTVSAGEEYTKNFNDPKNFTVTSVGDAFISPYTRYQSVLGITLSYNVFDFGARKDKLNIAKEETALKEILKAQAFQELRLSLTDTCAKIAISKTGLEFTKEILSLENKNYELTKRLYAAQELSKTELNNAYIRTLEIKKQAEELSQILTENLAWLSFYTGENYNTSLKITDLPDTKSTHEFLTPDYTKTLIWKMFEAEIRKKELELKLAKKNNYPKVAAYGRYYLYGSDHSSFNDNLQNVEPSNLTAGLSAYMPVFDGFYNHAEIKKAELELQKTSLARDKALAEWLTRLAVLKNNLFRLENTMAENIEIINALIEKEKLNKRLLTEGLISPIEANNTKIELLKEKSEYEKNHITLTSVSKGIEILATTL